MYRIWYKLYDLTGKKCYIFRLDYDVINLCLESTNLLENIKVKSIMSSVEKMSNILGDMIEEVVTTPSSENKSSTKDVDRFTGELEYMLVEYKGIWDKIYMNKSCYNMW